MAREISTADESRHTPVTSYQHSKAARRSGRWVRPIAFGATFIILSAGMAIAYFAVASHKFPVLDDLRIMREATDRLVGGGSWYLPSQLVGPHAHAHGDVLYPPVAAWFFLPWLVLPAWTFVVIPVAILAWFVESLRPAPWTWPIIALGIAYPPSFLFIVFGNPVLWIAVFVALGLRSQWPGVLVLLKPSLFPLALIGIRSRGWWVGFVALGVLSLPVIEPTLDYPRVILDTQGPGFLYSMNQLPLVLIPIVAWLGRRRYLASP